MTNQPAVLLITADQLRRDALGCYGGKAVATPNLDRLAATGTVFDRAYTASPWCLPSRSSILTGRYPRNHGAYSNFRDLPLSRELPNLYTVLGRAGYRVGHVGKCHYVPVPYGDTRADATLPYGEFRDYYLSLGIDDLWLQDDKQVSVWFADDYAAELAAAGHLEAYRDAVWDRSARKVFPFPGPAEWHPDRWVGRKAAEYLSGHAGEQPLFAWVSFSGPHFPFDPPEEYLDRVDDDALGVPDVRPEEFADERRIHHRSFHGPRHGWIEGLGGSDADEEYWRRLRRNYAANVAMIDDEVGRVLAAAEDRFGGDVEVVFTCDHGEMLGNHGFWGKGNCFYEDVLNVPLLHRSAGGAAPGRRSDALVSLVDVAPTLAEAATASGGLGEVDGRSLVDPGHDVVLAEGEGFLTVTDGRNKLAVVRKDGFTGRELFDLLQDPGEFTDVSGRPEYAAVERDLTAAALAALVDTTLA